MGDGVKSLGEPLDDGELDIEGKGMAAVGREYMMMVSCMLAGEIGCEDRE